MEPDFMLNQVQGLGRVLRANARIILDKRIIIEVCCHRFVTVYPIREINTTQTLRYRMDSCILILSLLKWRLCARSSRTR